MPDWFYHPVYKPIVSRLFSSAVAREISLTAMGVQSSTAVGRALFRFLASAEPPESARVTLCDLDFPSPIGLAPGIDYRAAALPLWPYLGFGFVELGPVHREPVERCRSTDPLCVPELLAIRSSRRAGAPGAEALRKRIIKTRRGKCPIGIYVTDPEPAQVIQALGMVADFFSLDPECLDSPGAARVRAATHKPLFLRITAGETDQQIDDWIAMAMRAGFSGCIIGAGARVSGVPDTELHGPFGLDRTLAVVKRIASRYGDAFPIIAAGGVSTPARALALLRNGARLVELYEGLIYAGPGLPKRILSRVAEDEKGSVSPPATVPSASDRPSPWVRLAILLAVFHLAVGMLTLGAGALEWMRPVETNLVSARLENFIVHNRSCLGGALLGLGFAYLWLARGPVRRKEVWSNYALVAAALVECFGAFARSALVLIGMAAAAAVIAIGVFHRRREMLTPLARAWIWSPAGISRMLLTIWALGYLCGGVAIAVLGSTAVFVAEDLDYLCIQPASYGALNFADTLKSISIDRTRFGVGLLATGLLLLPGVWHGIRPGDRSLLRIGIAVVAVDLLTVIGFHYVIGYTAFTHLVPFIAKDAAFILGAKRLHRVTIGTDSSREFPDFETEGGLVA